MFWIWLVGFLLALTNHGAENVHQSFRYMWGRRLEAFALLCMVIANILYSGNIAYIIFGSIIFTIIAIDEHNVNKIFIRQYKEMRDNDV